MVRGLKLTAYREFPTEEIAAIFMCHGCPEGIARDKAQKLLDERLHITTVSEQNVNFDILARDLEPFGIVLLEVPVPPR